MRIYKISLNYTPPVQGRDHLRETNHSLDEEVDLTLLISQVLEKDGVEESQIINIQRQRETIFVYVRAAPKPVEPIQVVKEETNEEVREEWRKV
jgi:hypothetical protein